MEVDRKKREEDRLRRNADRDQKTKELMDKYKKPKLTRRERMAQYQKTLEKRKARKKIKKKKNEGKDPDHMVMTKEELKEIGVKFEDVVGLEIAKRALHQAVFLP
jgi:hypothetical protein